MDRNGTENNFSNNDNVGNRQQEIQSTSTLSNDVPSEQSESPRVTISATDGIEYPDPNNPYKCICNGLPMTWNEGSQQWLPDVEVNEDFLAYYNASYGVQYDYANMPKPQPQRQQRECSEEAADKKKELKQQYHKLSKEEKLLKKRETKKRKAEHEAARRQEGWFEMDEEHNTNVYVSGFPPTIDEEQFIEFMSKCGVIQNDPRTGKPKVKLYRTETGEPKGDGTCCYIRMESVDLALQILDGWQWDSSRKIHVDRAKFELKGQFDPSKKRQRLTNAQKKKFLEKQQKVFEWKPDKPRNFRPRHESTVVFRGMFTLEQIDREPEKIFSIKEDTQKLCEQRFGPVKKLVLYDSNPEGVVTVTFENIEHANLALQTLNGRVVGGRVVQVSHWDGREKFKRMETAQERLRRENAWEEFLGETEEQGESDATDTAKDKNDGTRLEKNLNANTANTFMAVTENIGAASTQELSTSSRRRPIEELQDWEEQDDDDEEEKPQQP